MKVIAKLELIGFKNPRTGQIEIPRRALDPGAKVETVDYQFLSTFYEFDEQISLHIGNLVGYDSGENIVPAYLDINRLVTEHLAVLAMTGSGKSYTVGRIIERIVALNNGTVVVFDPHGEYGRALSGGKLQFNPDLNSIDDFRDRRTIPRIVNLGILDKKTNFSSSKLKTATNYSKGFYNPSRRKCCRR